ncbi:MAG: molybdopterin-dependent oxidoreductase [Aggregatilineales bacterium]
MEDSKHPAVLWGALVGTLLMIAALSIFFFGFAAASFVFVPFSLFDWIARTLPGPLITFGIDLMVDIIMALNIGSLAETAKTAEHILALIFMLAIGAIASALFFSLMRQIAQRGAIRRHSSIPGAALGISVGVPLWLITQAVPGVEIAGPILNAIWIVGVMLLWGAAVGWVYHMLAFGEAPKPQINDPAAYSSVYRIDRRRFLIQVGGATAAITVIGAGLGSLLRQEDSFSAAPSTGATIDPELAQQLAALPNADDPVVPAPGTRLEITPVEQHYRIDINSLPIVIPEESYTLLFVSALNDEGSLTVLKEFTLEELRSSYEPVSAHITMACISNRIAGPLIGTTLWTGVRLQTLLEDVGIPDGATHLKITSADGFDETVALDLIAADDRIMLAYAWDGQPLTADHGFPLRIHIPDRYGMKQPKWITSIEFISGDQDGYWVRRGWDKEAFVRATSVIDTVATSAMTTDEAGQQLIPIGGIAWAGARGISRVEVRVNGGEWIEARLRQPLSDRTWSIWRYDWPFTPGMHTFEVRCAEGDGTPQIEAQNPVRPSGATGIHSTRASV